MKISRLKISLFFVSFVILCPLGFIGVQSQKKEQPCDSCVEQLGNKKDEMVWFVSNELEKYAVHCEQPDIPKRGAPDGKIIVDVLTDSDGNVICVSSKNGNPVMRVLAEKALRKWKFKPIEINDKPVSLWGNVEISVSWKRDETAEQCSEINKRQ